MSKCRKGTKFATKIYSAIRRLPVRRLILHSPCVSFWLMNGKPFPPKCRISLSKRNASMVNWVMLASETPNKCKAFGFAATNRRSRLLTTTASTELASNSCKSFSLARRASCSLRALSRTFFSCSANVFSARRSCTVACSKATRRYELNLAISVVRSLRIRSKSQKSRFNLLQSRG